MDAHIIVISGLGYSGSSTLADSLSKRLNWELILAGERFRIYCRENGIDPNDAKQIPKEVHRQFDEKLTLEMGASVRTIFEGRIAIWLSTNLPYALRVWCRTDAITRITRCVQREGLSREKCAELIDNRDRTDSETFEMLYNIKLAQLPSGVLVVDTGVPVESYAEQIIELLA